VSTVPPQQLSIVQQLQSKSKEEESDNAADEGEEGEIFKGTYWKTNRVKFLLGSLINRLPSTTSPYCTSPHLRQELIVCVLSFIIITNPVHGYGRYYYTYSFPVPIRLGDGVE